MQKYGLGVLGVSEAKVKGNGVRCIRYVTCAFSGVQKGRAKAGVPILLSGRFGAYLKAWKCVDERIAWVRLKVEGVWVTVVQVYAPTEDSSMMVKDEFFQKLQETVESVARSDLMIVMGDFNARVGNDTSIWGDVLGSHGEEVCNENGKHVSQFSKEHNLLISSTWFPHKRIHTYTWECRGRGLKSIIDYFLIGKEARKQIVDVKVVRGAEIGSTHYIVLLKVKLRRQKWKRTAVRGMRQPIRIGRLNEDKVRRKYQEAIREKFKEARVNGCLSGNDVEKAWSELKEGLVEASSSVCGVVKRRHSGEKRSRWWNEEVKLAVRRKKLLYKRFLDTGTDEAKRHYNEAKTEAKRAARKTKNEDWMCLGRELEKDACGNQRRFWASVNGNKKERDRMSQICSRDGRILMEEEEVREC